MSLDRLRQLPSSIPDIEQMLPLPLRRSVWELRQAAGRSLRVRLSRPGRRGEAETRREELSLRYLRGAGIEIGALHRPLWVPGATRVDYVDFASRDELLRMWSDTYNQRPSVVETTVIDDGERLARFSDGSLDFIIANHLLEHIEDPIAAMQRWTRVVRPGGIVFITLPDARHTFDAARQRTTIEHLRRDHEEGPAVSREEHYREWAHIIECLPLAQVPDRMTQFAVARRREHFHVWELEGFLELLQSLELPLRLEAAQAVADEFSVVLRKIAPPG